MKIKRIYKKKYQSIKTPFLSIKNTQMGFTLIEVMVALAIFAMLSVVGWQVFDNLNLSKNRSKVHADSLSEIQFAYLQVQNDINQITAWQTLPLATALKTEAKDATNSNDTENNDSATDVIHEVADYNTLNFFELSDSGVNFIRYADSDPRYKSSPTFVKVVYSLEGDALVRSQSTLSMGAEADSSKPITSVLLANVNNLQLQAFTPKAVSSFSSQTADEGGSAEDMQEPQLLPKGVSFSFNYRDEPINWTIALPEQSPALVSNYQVSEKENTEEPDKSSDDKKKTNAGDDGSNQNPSNNPKGNVSNKKPANDD